MSTSDNVLPAAIGPVDQVAQWVAAALDLESIRPLDLKEGEYLFQGAARTGDGELILLVAPNGYVEADPEPEDVQAIDPYPIDVKVRLVGRKDEELQLAETRAVFGELVEARPEIAMCWCTTSTLWWRRTCPELAHTPSTL